VALTEREAGLGRETERLAGEAAALRVQLETETERAVAAERLVEHARSREQRVYMDLDRLQVTHTRRAHQMCGAPDGSNRHESETVCNGVMCGRVVGTRPKGIRVDGLNRHKFSHKLDNKMCGGVVRRRPKRLRPDRSNLQASS
jgi:hypothetical protein